MPEIRNRYVGGDRLADHICDLMKSQEFRVGRPGPHLLVIQVTSTPFASASSFVKLGNNSTSLGQLLWGLNEFTYVEILGLKLYTKKSWILNSPHTYWGLMIIVILLKTCVSPRETHTHTQQSHFFFFKGLTLVPDPKPWGSGSETLLTEVPCLRCSGSYTCPLGNSSSESRNLVQPLSH